MIPHAPCPLAIASPSIPGIGPSSGRPSAELGRAHARSPRGLSPLSPGRNRVAFSSSAGASASASGFSFVNVEPTAEIPRAVTAENSAVGAPSSLVSASIPTSSSTCRGASGSSSSTTTPHNGVINGDSPRLGSVKASGVQGPAATATAPAGWWVPPAVTPVARPSSIAT